MLPMLFCVYQKEPGAFLSSDSGWITVILTVRYSSYPRLITPWLHCSFPWSLGPLGWDLCLWLSFCLHLQCWQPCCLAQVSFLLHCRTCWALLSSRLGKSCMRLTVFFPSMFMVFSSEAICAIFCGKIFFFDTI